MASVETFHIVPVMHTKRLGTTQLTTYQRQHSGSLMTTSSQPHDPHTSTALSLQTLLSLRTESLILCVCTVQSESSVSTANSAGGFCASVPLPFWCCSVISGLIQCHKLLFCLFNFFFSPLCFQHLWTLSV